MQPRLGDVLPKVREDYLRSPSHLNKTRQKSLDIVAVDLENDDQSGSASNQLVLYNPGTSNTGQDVLAVADPSEDHAGSYQSFLASNPSSRVLPSVGAFTVQCAACFKWRFIPTKEKYEEIRESILQDPFVCERAREWRPDISCGDPEDISQDGSRLWAIDKPNIAQPPPGWERLLRIRGEGSSRFADIYYAAPSGKRLRSMVEIEKYLLEHPEYIREGVNLSQFSFQIPKPLQENYVRKRPARATNLYDTPGSGLLRPLEPSEVNPISWASPPTCTELRLGGPGSSSASHTEPEAFRPLTQLPPAKKKRARPRPRKIYDGSVCDQPPIDIEDHQQARDASSYEL